MSLVNLPLYQRKLILSRLFKPQTGVLKAVDVVKASSKEQLSQALNKILEERGEGVVVKHPLSTYRLGVRPPTWCKLKPDYVDEVGESLTLMIVGELLLSLSPARHPSLTSSRAQAPTSARASVAAPMRVSSPLCGTTASLWTTKVTLSESLMGSPFAIGLPELTRMSRRSFNSLVQLGSGFKLSDFKWIQSVLRSSPLSPRADLTCR